jgi:hypothetical protein
MALNGMSPSELLAASCYARGLWSPVLVWRAISDKPYRGSPIQWGLDREFINVHLRRAASVATGFTILYLVLVWWFVKTNSPPLLSLLVKTNSVWLVFTLLLVLFLQWTLVPWGVIRLGWVKGRRSNGGGSPELPVTKLLCKDSTSALPDLGFLLREATFSVDCTCRAEPGEGQVKESSGTPLPGEFYDAVAEAANRIPSFRVRPLTIVTAAETQPGGGGDWGPWYRTRYSSKGDGSERVSRLVILGEQTSIDGFASAEFLVQEVKPHLSFLLRLRWMPPLRKWLHGLGFLGEQRVWWRAGLLPALFVAILLLVNWLGGRLEVVGENPDYAQYAPYAGLALVLFKGVLAAAVLVAAFGPIVIFLLIVLYRIVRCGWGAFHALTGTHLGVHAPGSFRYLSTRTIFENGDEFQWGVACSQITQEVITNCVVGVLRKYGIDTRSIRDEVRTFINEGVYMTGGSITAENLAVGNLARILQFRSKIRKARSGQRSLVGRGQKAA